MDDSKAVDLSEVVEIAETIPVVDTVIPEETQVDTPDASDDPVWLAGAKARELVKPDYNPVETLLLKLERWLLQQPEWAVILAAPRQVRRQAITLLAKRILTIPARYSNFGG